jgi:hypothetical protein
MGQSTASLISARRMVGRMCVTKHSQGRRWPGMLAVLLGSRRRKLRKSQAGAWEGTPGNKSHALAIRRASYLHPRRRSLAGDVLRLRLRLERAPPFRTSSCAPSPPYRQGTHVMRPCHGRRPLESVASQTSREHVRICRLTVHVQSGSSWRRGLRVFCTWPNGSGLHVF